MLAFKEFSLLTLEDKASRIWHEGIYLMHRFDKSNKIELYALDGFFVEVGFTPFYAPVDEAIVHMKWFKNPIYLDPYLRKIRIDDSNIF